MTLPFAPEAGVAPPPAPAAPKNAGSLRGVFRAFTQVTVGAWKLFLGMVFCQSFFGSILVVGWTMRFLQRTLLKSWWRAGKGTEPEFAQFAAGQSRFQGHATSPNWITGPNYFATVWRTARATVRGAVPADSSYWWRLAGFCVKGGVASLWQNLRAGIGAIFNVWVVTMPACILWLFAWYDGWNNSFNKGYEQAAVGPLTGVVGTFLFIAAMYYLPVAQARQAATGRWRSFYEFGLIWSLIRRRWLACLGLSIAYSLVSVPVTVLRTLPAFFTQMNPALADLPPERVESFLNQYFFWCALVIFPAYVGLRWLAGRIYASAMLSAVRSGAVTEDALSEFEWETFNRLDLLRLRPSAPRHAWVRWLSSAGSRAGRFAAGLAMFFVWFTFLAQIFISEFINYHPVIGWLNQPLVQLPWFHYLPPH